MTAHDVVQAELRKHRWLRQLPHEDRRQIEELAAAVAKRVAELAESAAGLTGGAASRPS